jgi:hypothetical protein
MGDDYRCYQRYEKPVSNWDAAKLPKLAKRSTFTPPMNNKTKRY